MAVTLAILMKGSTMWGQVAFDEARQYIVGEAEKVFAQMLAERMPAWTSAAIQHVLPPSEEGSSTPAVAEQLATRRGDVERLLQQQVAAALPELTDQALRAAIFRDITGDPNEIRVMKQRIAANLSQLAKASLDAMVKGWSDRAIGKILACAQPRHMDDVCPLPGVVDLRNLSGTIDRLVQPGMLGPLFERPLAEALGQATVHEIHGRIKTALNGELPQELHDYLMTGIDHFKADAQTLEQYLPGVQWDKWKDTLLGKTVIHLPNTVYGAMLAGSAARHFSKVICGPFCFNAYELERGIEVIQFLTWQLTHREGIAISVGQLVGFLGKAGEMLHLPDPSQWGKLGNAFAKGKEKLEWFEENLHKLDARYKQGVQTVTAHMEQIVQEFEGKLLELQATLLTPLQQAIDMTNEGFGVIRGKIQEVVKPWDTMMQKVKDYFVRLEGKCNRTLWQSFAARPGGSPVCVEYNGKQYDIMMAQQTSVLPTASTEAASTSPAKECTINEGIVKPLTPYTGPEPLGVDIAGLTSATQTALQCFRSTVEKVGGTLTVNSAYRPQAYQNHLREVWDTYTLLRDSQTPECNDVKNAVTREFIYHNLLASQRPAAVSNHTSGLAFDARINHLPTDKDGDALAAACNLHRPVSVADPVHYELK